MAKTSLSIKKPQTATAETVGARIRERREALGLSQASLAERSGIDLASLSKLENGRSGARGPTLSRLVQVAGALGVQPSELLT